MLSREERQKIPRLTNYAHILQVFKERGKKLFGHSSFKEMIKESITHMKNISRSVFFEDNRINVKSNWYLMFISDYGKPVVIPCSIDERNITFLTLKDLEEDNNPNFYIEKYNNIGSSRGFNKLPLMYREK